MEALLGAAEGGAHEVCLLGWAVEVCTHAKQASGE